MAGEKPTSDAKKERLAKALKANISKRKAQAKTRVSATDAAKLPPEDEGCPN